MTDFDFDHTKINLGSGMMSTSIRSSVVSLLTIDPFSSCCLLVIEALVGEYVALTVFLIKSNAEGTVLGEPSPPPSQERTFVADAYTARIIETC